MNSVNESGGADSRTSRTDATSDVDLEMARESIRSERVLPGGTEPTRPWKKGISRFKESFLLICTLVTSVVAVGGLVFTIFQFDKTMKAQRHATAEAAVGQFIVQVMELSTQANMALANESNRAVNSGQGGNLRADMGSTSPEKPTISGACSEAVENNYSLLDNFVVSRAQMLIDGEETGKFAGDILRFLTANQYGPYIGRKPCTTGPRVSVEGLVLVDPKLAHADVEGVFLKCLGFEQGQLESVVFINGVFQHIVLNKTNLMTVDFNKAWFSEINFNDISFLGEVDFSEATLNAIDFNNVIFAESLVLSFDRATLLGVDFGNSSLMTKSISFDKASILHSNLSGIKYGAADTTQEASTDDLHDNLAIQLSKAKSLYGTQLDEQVVSKLIEILGEENYQKIVRKPEGKYRNIKAPQSDWAWDENCPPKQRRDRHFDIASGDSFGVLQALFSPDP